MCAFFFLTLPSLVSSHPIFSFAVGSVDILCFLLLLLALLPSFHSFNVLTSSPSTSLSLPLSPSFNLSSLCHSQSQDHCVSASYSSFDPSTQSPLCPSFPFIVKPADSRLLTVVFAFFSPPLVFTHYSSIVCLICVCVHMHMSWGNCACLSLRLRVRGCVRGPAPPCPLSLERLLSGSLAFRFKLNHKDESSLFFFFSFFPILHPPLLPNLPSFFSTFCLHEGGRKQDREKLGREQGKVGVWGQKTTESCVFFTKVQKQTARNATHRYPPSPPHPTMCSPLSPPCDSPQRVNHGPGDRKLSFHSIRLTTPQTLSICSQILLLFQFDQI